MNINSVQEALAFGLYLLLVLGVGVYFFVKGRKNTGDKSYFLGGREMNGWVAALSAGASDMSAWVLMGLPGSIYLYGMGQVWISVGLLIGTICAWVFIAPRLRRMTIAAEDSITIPQFLTNRFKSKNPTLQVVCAIVFIIVYCVYSASSISACGTLFNYVFGMDEKIAMVGAAVIIIVYTTLGGFNAVCWTDFFQGMMMLAALMVAPIVAVIVMNTAGFAPLAEVVTPKNYYNPLSGGGFNWQSVSDIISGLGWGLGYFGMPHILVRYMSIKSEKEMKKSRVIGIMWTTLILIMASVVALVAHEYLGTSLSDGNQKYVFITMVRELFKAVPFIVGLLLSAILAASMSTADSQLLASSSAFASDFYKAVIRRDAKDKEMMWVGRAIVVFISIVALVIALLPGTGGIMGLVECAWGAFGAAFGPVIILALYWKRLTYKGSIAGIIAGFVVDAFWYACLTGAEITSAVNIYNTKIFEIVPGFLVGLAVTIIVSLLDKEPSKDIEEMFEKGLKPTE